MKTLAWLLVILSWVAAFDWDVETALDKYVQSDDGYFHWEVLDTFRYNRSCTLHVVNMTSQKWQDETYVDRPIWWHYMAIAVPDEGNISYTDAAFLAITGGNNDFDDEPPAYDDADNVALCAAALDASTVGAYIKQIPNQPLYFANDPTNERRTEDEVIAWTWRTYIDQPVPDPTVILRMPMTKAAKRGLDTVNQVAALYHSYTPNITRFMLTGASKRGWTTWSLSATDRRVVAMAPIVFSLLNMNETLMAHYRSLAGWSFAFEPYYVENITAEFFNPKMAEVIQHEDMYNYRERYTIPLLQLVATGDQFFLLQDSHQWWDDIPNPKWTCMFENTDHSMFPHYLKIYQTLISWWKALLSGERLPNVTWEMGQTETGGYIDFFHDPDFPPDEVRAFSAVTLANDTIRDFRLANIDPTDGEIKFHPVFWSDNNTTLTKVEDGHWRAEAEKVDGEWVGLVVRGMWYDNDDKRMFFSSEVNVIPDTFTVEPCTDAESCYAELV